MALSPGDDAPDFTLLDQHERPTSLEDFRKRRVRVISDFSLMDAIESGTVKIPRAPVDDDAATDQPSYLHVGDQPPK